MAESTLSLSYDDLQSEIGNFLHLGPDPVDWTAEDTSQVDRFIQTGLRWFYYPPAIEDVPSGYKWTFLYPSTTISTIEGIIDYDLPDDFGSMRSDINLDMSVSRTPIKHISKSQIDMLHQKDDSAGVPRYYSIYYKPSNGSDGQRNGLLLWPTPDAAYEMSFDYEGYAGAIDPYNYKYPLGGMKHSETILASCLAAAEIRANDEGDGPNWRRFVRLLQSSIALDKRQQGRHYGHMGTEFAFDEPPRATQRVNLNSTVTYNGVQL